MTARDIDTGTSQLLCSVRDGVAVITLNRPDARNALSPDLTPALRRMIKERGDDPEVGALLITGAGTGPGGSSRRRSVNSAWRSRLRPTSSVTPGHSSSTSSSRAWLRCG